MASEKRDFLDQRRPTDQRPFDPPPEFDAEALVDDMLGLSEWLRDRRDSR